MVPERVLVRSSHEIKPIYVDFTSAVSVDMLTRFARDAEAISISEMLPGPDGLWLQDRNGRSYTSELRMIAVDPKSFDDSVWRAAMEVP
jgi:hypothetical protein